jgi:hypothetical protein
MKFELPERMTSPEPPRMGLEHVVDERLVPRLAGLSPVLVDDQKTFTSAAANGKCKSWLFYFPFLHSFGHTPGQPLLWENAAGSICIYILRNIKEVPRLRLYLPPFPFARVALESAEARQREFNGDGRCQVVWADQQSGPDLLLKGYRLDYRESEYLYDGDLVRSAAGGDFERLRRYVNRARRTPGLAIRSYQHSDQGACLDLLARWRRQRNEDGVSIDGYGFTKRCIENAPHFEDGILRGEVAIAGEKLVAFTFGGCIAPGVESIFITISDHEFPGLGYLQRHRFISNAPSTKFFNDSSDADLSGLEQVKSSFRAIEMNHLYRATLGE